MTRETNGRWAARCDCYNGHASASGRCKERDVTDMTIPNGAPALTAVLCGRCHAECRKVAVSVARFLTETEGGKY